MKAATRIKRMLIAIDQAAWCLLTFGGGSPDETISAAAYRLERKGHWFGRYARPTIDLIARRWEEEHCLNAWLAEGAQAQLPNEYRKEDSS